MTEAGLSKAGAKGAGVTGPEAARGRELTVGEATVSDEDVCAISPPTNVKRGGIAAAPDADNGGPVGCGARAADKGVPPLDLLATFFPEWVACVAGTAAASTLLLGDWLLFALRALRECSCAAETGRYRVAPPPGASSSPAAGVNLSLGIMDATIFFWAVLGRITWPVRETWTASEERDGHHGV